MHGLSNGLSALDDARAAAVDKVVAVDNKDVAPAGAMEGLYLFAAPGRADLARGAVEPKAAEREDDAVGLGGEELLERQRRRRSSRGRAVQRLPPRGGDELWDPICVRTELS